MIAMADSFGIEFSGFVRKKLQDSNLATLGRVNGTILGEWAEEFWQFFVMREKAARRAKLAAKRKPVSGIAAQIPPTLEMVRQHIEERGYTFKAEKFMAYYDSKGWVVGKAPMRNWCAACVTFQGDAPRRPVAGVQSKPAASAIPEPQGWREAITSDEDDGHFAAGWAWESILPFYQSRILTKVRKSKGGPA